MSGFVVSASLRLVDQFSAQADRISQKATLLGNRLGQLKNKIFSFKNMVLGGIGGLMAGIGVQHLLREGALEEQLVTRFKFAFDAAKDRIKIGSEDLAKLMKSIVVKTGVDLEDLQGAIVTPLLQASELSGDNLKRMIQATVDAARFMGKTTAVEFSGMGRAMAKAMQNPLLAMRALSQVSMVLTKEQKKSIQELMKVGDIVGAQVLILDLIESRVGGFAAKNTIGKSMMTLNNILGDTSAAAGGLIHVFVGPLMAKAGVHLAKLNEFVNKLTDSLREGGEINFGSALVEAFQIVKSTMEEVFGDISALFNQAYEALKPYMTSMGNYLKDVIGNGIREGIKLGIIGLPSLALEIAAMIASGISGGIKEAIRSVTGIGGIGVKELVNPVSMIGKALMGTVGVEKSKIDVNVKVTADPGTTAKTTVDSMGSGLKVGKNTAGEYDSNGY